MKPKKDPSTDKLGINSDEKAAILKRKDTLDNEEADVGATVEASNGRKTAVMIACLYMHLCAYGLPAALAVVYAELIPALDVPRSQAALVQSLCMGGTLVGGVFMTGPIRTFGSGKCVMLASVVGTMAMALTFFATNIQTIIVSVGVVSGLALSVLVLAGFVAVGQIFTIHKKVALASLTLGVSVGLTVLPPVTQVLINMYNWNGAILVLSAIVMLNCVPCGIILWCSEQYLSLEVNVNEEIGTKETRHCCRWLWDIAFVIFVATSFLSRIVGNVEILFIVDLALMKGFTGTEGAGLLSINGIFGFVGRAMAALVLKCLPSTAPEWHLGYGFALCGLAHFLIIYVSKYWAEILAVAVRGNFTGLVLGITPAMVVDIRGPAFFMESVAICHSANGLGNTLGGYLGGLSVDLTGDYVLMFYISTAISVYCGLSMVPIYLIRKRKEKKDESNFTYYELQ